ncbi:MAG: tetratricopeptide repeat protein, partial [Ilumatobacteraceae bacterium]
AQFGLARLAAAAGRRDAALASLDRIPVSSRAYGEARHKRAVLLSSGLDDDHALGDLDAAARELDRTSMDPSTIADLRIQILASALDVVRRRGPAPTTEIGGVRAEEQPLRHGLEKAYRDAAKLAGTAAERVRLIDLANAVRPRTFV